MFAASKTGAPVTAKDPQFKYVTMLLHGDGTNGAQNNTFLDSSTNNFTITRNGNTTQGTYSPYGANWSNYFDGTGDNLSAPSNAAWTFGTGDFTIEAWINGTWGADNFVVSSIGGAGSANWGIEVYGGNIRFTSYTTLFLSATQPSQNSWHHVAVSRSGTTLSMFVDGARVATASNSTNFTTSSALYVGDFYNGAAPFLGYISNVRVVKGTAVYDPTASTYVVPTGPLTAITNTVLLTCQSNRFIDNSTNNFTITKAGDTSVQRFSPFSPTSAYSTNVIGGSGYFDGSGDYLNNNTNNTALAMGTGDFTIEFWMNSPSSALQVIYDSRLTTSSSTGGFQIYHQSGTVYFYGGATTNVLLVSASITYNQWNHVAIVRSGSSTGNVKMYINGALASTYGSADTSNYSQGYLVLGAFNNPSPSSYYIGYFSDFRFVKGTAVYTSAFTPPTAPLTAITNTSLLLSYTNAGILDNAEMNDLETVGNAQISTSVKKFGTGSMYFDGTGDGLQAIGTPNTVFGTGDFTVEFWIYLNANTGTFKKFVELGTSGSCFTIETQGTNNVLTVTDLNNTVFITASSALSLTTWTHVAVTRSGTSMKLFQDGVQVGSATNSTNFGNSGNVYIGQSNSGQAVNCYMDDLRITKGYARYTSNFTPPTAAFPNN